MKALGYFIVGSAFNALSRVALGPSLNYWRFTLGGLCYYASTVAFMAMIGMVHGGIRIERTPSYRRFFIGRHYVTLMRRAE